MQPFWGTRTLWGIGLLLLGGVVRGEDNNGPWIRVDQGQTGKRTGAVLVPIDDHRQMLLFGLAKDVPFVQSFDPQSRAWRPYSDAEPFKSDFNNPNRQPGFTYQAAYHPATKCVYFLSLGNVLYAFDVAAKSWRAFPPAPELDDLAWPTLASEANGERLVVVGAEKKGNQLGWSRTVVFDVRRETWSRLTVADPVLEREHVAWLAAHEAFVELVGRIRSAWYRDKDGTGTDSERSQILDRVTPLVRQPLLKGVSAELERVRSLVLERKLLPALQVARACQRQVEELAEAHYPVPCSRRNSPLVYDPRHRVFVLFGGDHQDYLLNDTWILDLERGAWRRAQPDAAPSPRAGHAFVALPKSGKLALYEGYEQSTSTDYGAVPFRMLSPVQLWLYDVPTNRWELSARWTAPMKGEDEGIAPVSYFYGGEAHNRYAAPPLAAGPDDQLVLAAGDTQGIYWCRWKRPATTWLLPAIPRARDEALRAELAVAPNSRLYRPGIFRAEFCEVDDPPPDTGLDQLPPNQWVKLPAPPRNPCQGCRGRDWSTSVWDSDREQILLWGGGHCVRSSSPVVHYSPTSGRMVEGFDADESYGSNSPADGTLAYDSSLVGRPFVSVHNYKHYAYDPKGKMLVSARGYLYDPDRMDWLRHEKLSLPFQFRWGSTVVASTPHGVVAWAGKPNGEDGGLWLFDRSGGWIALRPEGKLFVPWCDTHGMVYDSKRDRLVLTGIGGGYGKTNDGSFLTFDFATRALRPLVPEHSELGKTSGCLREVVYVEHLDWILLGHTLRTGDAKTGKAYTRVYDCRRNRLGLLDAGKVPDGHDAGWMYDARRKLAYSFSVHGETWALRIEPASARLLEAPLE